MGVNMTEKITMALLVGISGFFAPLYILIFWMFVFVIVDMVTGMLASKKRGEILSSKKLKRTIAKIGWYSTVIILAEGMDNGVLPFIALHASQLVTGIICGVELYSNLENLHSLTGNKVFYILTQWTTKKVEETAGVNINKTLDSDCEKMA